MPVQFFPSTDGALVTWSANFKNLITATPTAYGLTAALATAYGALNDAYATAYATAVDPSTRTKGTVEAKNVARTALKTNARLLANLVYGTAAVTNQQKIDLGLTVRAHPTPIPPPSIAPVLLIESVSGWTARIRLKPTLEGRGKPAGVSGSSIFSHVGTTPPADIGEWKFEGNLGRTTVDVVFPTSLAAGTKVWLTAFWFNGRKESGPPCAPVSVNLPGGTVSVLTRKAA